MINRSISDYIHNISRHFSVIGIMGPRQSGKTTLAKSAFPDYEYVNFEHQTTLNEARESLDEFMLKHPAPVIFDEIQRCPEVLNEIQVWVDAHGQPPASYVLTGSNQPHLRGAVSESLAGRIALAYLLPLSFAELKGGAPFDRAEAIVRGFMPRIHASDVPPDVLFENYFSTYVSRDVNQLINLKDATRFATLVRLLAARVGQLVNYNSLADELGVSVATVQDWISVMEASFIVFRLHPYYRNYGKRFVKTPKIYFTEVGLAAHLLGLRNAEQVVRDPLFGQLFENMVVANVRKNRFNAGEIGGGTAGMYFIRDRHGDEIDLVIERDARKLDLIEIKSTRAYNPDHARTIEKYAKIVGADFGVGRVVYAGTANTHHGVEYVNFADS